MRLFSEFELLNNWKISPTTKTHKIILILHDIYSQNTKASIKINTIKLITNILNNWVFKNVLKHDATLKRLYYVILEYEQVEINKRVLKWLLNLKEQVKNVVK